MKRDFYNDVHADLAGSAEIQFQIEAHPNDLENTSIFLKTAFSAQTNTAVRRLPIITEGLHVYWKFKNEEAKFIQGEFNICHPYTAFSYNDASSVIYLLPDSPGFLCYIDNHPKIADDVYAIAAIDEGTGGIILGYSDAGQCYTLSINWEEYHQCLLYTLGYPHWQMFFAKKLNDDQVKWLKDVQLPEMLADMNICFPQKNMYGFINMIKSKNSVLKL